MTVDGIVHDHNGEIVTRERQHLLFTNALDHRHKKAHSALPTTRD